MDVDLRGERLTDPTECSISGERLNNYIKQLGCSSCKNVFKLDALAGVTASLALVIVLSSISADVIVLSAINPPGTFVNAILLRPS